MYKRQGQLRLRGKGSAGGHNGIKNIIQQLGTQTFKRIKVGVGEKPEGYDLADYVLGRFHGEEKAIMEDARKRAAKAAAVSYTHLVNKHVDNVDKFGKGRKVKGFGCV